MNIMAMQETELLGDAELVGLCLSGDRDAFGRIVERYQSLVCALAYSACGDLARSEDLAQETFIAAWRQLSALKEPAKLKYWLCGIVRNLIHNSVRTQTRNPLATAVPLEDEVAAGPERDAPSDEAMSKEEETILWRVLEKLPRLYRDPLVLFYRSGDSTAFAVHVETAATHITMNPVAVNMQCHSARRARATFTPQGLSYGF